MTKSVDWSQRTVLVTGAGGFIGSHLAERLVQLGARTKALVRYNSSGSWGWLDRSACKGDIEIVAGDVRDPDSIRSAVSGVNTLFHLAALVSIPYSYYTPLAYIRTNVEGVANVLQAALDREVDLVVNTSSSEVYGTAQYVPIDESHPLQGQSPYSASKIGGDKLAEAFHRSFDLPVATIRPFNTYGPRQSARAIIPAIITQALARSDVRLGSLTPLRDLTYVEDTVEGFVRVAEQPQAIGQVVNIGSGREISIGDLAKTVLEMMDSDSPVVGDDRRVRPQNSEVERLRADIGKAQQLLDWRPSHSLKDGIERTIEWVRANTDRYRAETYAI